MTRHLFGEPGPDERFRALDGADDAGGRRVLERIAAKIGRTRRPGANSDIPAGATYLAQFAVHDLDFRSREETGPPRLDLALIYGDGPKHDAYCYQLPTRPGEVRDALRLGRTRPTAASPAWGAQRDLPRIGCPHLDGDGSEANTEVLVPNAFSDSNALLAQMQTLWALTHNAVLARLRELEPDGSAFESARAVTREVYRGAIRRDVLGTWLMPKLRGRYLADAPTRIADATLGTPLEFMAGVARLGHGMVREIYDLNDQMPVAGLRDIIRHNSQSRPHAMPLTEDWLVDFSRFFTIGASVPQRARAIGPHVARAFADAGGSQGAAGRAESLVVRDLVACSRAGLRSVGSLIESVRAADAGALDGCLAQDRAAWTGRVREWLRDADLAAADIERLAGDPPLTLYLMLEAEADADGRTLGGLGSILMGETFTAALELTEESGVDLAAARVAAFGGHMPDCMADLILFLQRHYSFADGARLHPGDEAKPHRVTRIQAVKGEPAVLDMHQGPKGQPIPRIEVADYIEMGRLVADWTRDPSTRPETVQELKQQLDGIAVVPDRVKEVEFVQGTLEKVVMRLPPKEMLEESLERMSDPMGNGTYPLPQFYQDHYRPGFGPVLTPLDVLLARVGDYTIAQCR